MHFLKTKKTTHLFLLFSACVLFFTGCSNENTAVESSTVPQVEAEQAESIPTEALPKEIQIGPYSFPEDTEVLDLSDVPIDLEELCKAASDFPKLRSISLGNTDASAGALRMVVSSFSDAEVFWSVSLFGSEFSNTTEILDLSALTDEDVPAVAAELSKLFSLKTVQLCPDDGFTALSYDSIAMLNSAAPEAELNCRFELYGLTADWETEELRYFRVKIGDPGIDVFRSALPYLRSLTLLRLERCEIKDYESMAALKEAFPEKNIVWSVQFAGYDFMTDTTLMNSPLIRDNNAYLLQYFPDVLYLDIGHNRAITNIEFVKYFPKLTTVILSITKISDISPLANCPDIEFLECFSTNVDDISCLAGLKKLEYLNLGDNKNLRDLSPLYELENLKIVRLCQRSFDHLTKEDAEILQEHLPNCFVSTVGGHSANSGNWRYNNDGSMTERYALLKEQMRYHLMWQDRQTNSPSGEEESND